MLNLVDKTAVITGGASGIGYAIAERFGREGCNPVIADIDGEALEAALASLQSKNINAHGVLTDVSSYESMQNLAAVTKSHFGGCDFLFNNAGVSITGPSWKMSADDWRWVWDVNVWGVVNGVRAFLPDMIDGGRGGYVVNTGSLASFNGNGDHAPYCSSKAAVLGLTQSLYSEMKATMTGIGVSIVCPGMVDTRIHQSSRNRPSTDHPWSDREFADDSHMRQSDEFQRRGISAAEIAESVLSAMREQRFYIFTGEVWPSFMRATVGRAVEGINPLVLTWGEDLREHGDREAPPWQSQPGAL